MFYWIDGLKGPLKPKSVDQIFALYLFEEKEFVKMLQKMLPDGTTTPAAFCHFFERVSEEVRVEPTKFSDPNYLISQMRDRRIEIAAGLYDIALGDAVEDYLQQMRDAKTKEGD